MLTFQLPYSVEMFISEAKSGAKTRMSKIPFSLSPKSTWRVWNQWRGTHSVWQCLPFIYLLCAMQAIAPSSISLAHELLLLSLSLSLAPACSLSLPPSLSLTYSAARICFAFQSRRSHLEWSWKTIIHTETKHIQADSTAFEKKISHFNYLSVLFLNSHLLCLWIHI